MMSERGLASDNIGDDSQAANAQRCSSLPDGRFAILSIHDVRLAIGKINASEVKTPTAIGHHTCTVPTHSEPMHELDRVLPVLTPRNESTPKSER